MTSSGHFVVSQEHKLHFFVFEEKKEAGKGIIVYIRDNVQRRTQTERVLHLRNQEFNTKHWLKHDFIASANDQSIATVCYQLKQRTMECYN